MNAQVMTPRSAPHIGGPRSVSQVMGLVMLALLPATLFGIWLFGWPALFLFVIAIATALLTEAACLKMAGKPIGENLYDGSAVLTAWLLALSLPPWAPWWIAAFGTIFAIVIGKHIFGGLGQNLFNPAMLARTMLLISFPVEMTAWIAPHPFGSADALGFMAGLSITFQGIADLDAVTSASVLGHVKTALSSGTASSLDQLLPGHYDALHSAIGTTAGSLGETSGLLFLAGGLFLIFKRIISWHIPVAMLAAVAVLAGSMHLYNPELYASPAFHLLNGGLLLGAFFIATDPVTSPVSVKGKLLFGACAGVLVYVIRQWAGYPEGVAFAVLLMNAATPLIDHYLRPRVFGRTASGAPLPLKGGDA
jgi:electron transport complex protein RnfD